MTLVQQAAITGMVQNELVRLGYKCSCSSNLSWFTDKPIHKKSINTQSQFKQALAEPYMTSLGYATALKFYDELKHIKD